VLVTHLLRITGDVIRQMSITPSDAVQASDGAAAPKARSPCVEFHRAGCSILLITASDDYATSDVRRAANGVTSSDGASASKRSNRAWSIHRIGILSVTASDDCATSDVGRVANGVTSSDGAAASKAGLTVR
jgi:hypothetical protein